jgi:hypothetical protein
MTISNDVPTSRRCPAKFESLLPESCTNLPVPVSQYQCERHSKPLPGLAYTRKHSIQMVAVPMKRAANLSVLINLFPGQTCEHSIAFLTILDMYRLKHLHISSLIYAYALCISDDFWVLFGWARLLHCSFAAAHGQRRPPKPTNKHSHWGRIGFLDL